MSELPRAEIPGSEAWRNLHLDTVVRGGKRTQRMLVEIPVDGNGCGFREVEETDDVVGLLAPRRMRLEAQFTPRGGITTTIVAEHVAK